MASSPSTGNLSFGPGVLRWAPLGTTEPVALSDAWPAGWVRLGYTPEGHQSTHSLAVSNAEVAELLDPVKRVTTSRDSKVDFALAEITAAHLKVVLNGGTITPTNQAITDVATTAGSATITSATAVFTASDVGLGITGTGIPGATTILSVTSATTAVMSAVASASGTITATIAARFSDYVPPQVGAEVRAMLGWDADDGLERVIWRQVLQVGDSATPRRKGTDYARFGASFGLEAPASGAAPFVHRFAASRVAA